MPYYLQHYFNPAFNHKSLTPAVMADGNISAHYLGYVHNVVAGQLLAELLPLDHTPQPHTRPEDEKTDFFADNGASRINPKYVYDEPVFPLGPNCGRDPENPNHIIALCNGFCFYHQGLITVKKLLNVRQDVNFRTGNILFANDIAVHGGVFPGFSLWGENILVKKHVDGGFLIARNSITCLDGVKGAPTASLEAGGAIRLAFCEAARIKSGGNLIIDGSCLHSELFVDSSLIVKGRLQGGVIHAGNVVYVKEQLGSDRGASTRICMGESPSALLRLRDMQAQLHTQEQKIKYYQSRMLLGPMYEQESAPYLELAQRKRDVALSMRLALQRKLREDARNAYPSCRVVVPGTVYPGVEIVIGRAEKKIVDPLRNVNFCLRDGEIVHDSPAVRQKTSM